jgi:hypothetical protein
MTDIIVVFEIEQKTMKRLLLVLLFLFKFSICFCQNLITNPDFELYSSCPTALGQVDRAISWFEVVQSSDYYNCGLSPSSFIFDATAYSGTGFMGFASYGNSNGSGEAIGQSLIQPLLPQFTYSISFAAKKPAYTKGADTCSGLALYGFKNSLPPSSNLIHASQLPSAILLGSGATIQDSSWQIFSFDFTPTDTINHIVFTGQFTPFCYEYILLDSVCIKLTHTIIMENDKNNNLSLYPNPCNGELTISNSADISEIVIYDIFGQTILNKKVNLKSSSLFIDHEGIYFISIKVDDQILTRRIIVTR